MVDFPSPLRRFWNLQTLIIERGDLEAPLEIWNMYHLKHVNIDTMTLSYPPQHVQDDELVLKNLQTLCRVCNFKFTEEVVKRVPNIKKLKIRTSPRETEDILTEDISEYQLSNLGRLHKLESLTCQFNSERTRGRRPSSFGTLQENIITFSHSLVKLKLFHAPLSWEEVTWQIGSLPNLQALKLQDGVEGSEWNVVEGKFQRLKFLSIMWMRDLKYWTMSESGGVHFPCLEHLSLDLVDIEEMPPRIDDYAPNLRLIKLSLCKYSLRKSVHEIQKEQAEYGDDVLKVQLSFTLPNAELHPEDPDVPYDVFVVRQWMRFIRRICEKFLPESPLIMEELPPAENSEDERSEEKSLRDYHMKEEILAKYVTLLKYGRFE